MSNDGHAWLAKGDRHTAAQMFESVLAGCLRTYGEDHRYTSDARRNLAAAER